MIDAAKHLDRLSGHIPELAVCREDIRRAFELLAGSFHRSGKLLLAGNGGSAADCEHWAAELLKGFVSKRPLPDELRLKIGPAMADKLQGGLAAIPLPALMSFSTAWNNDAEPELVYAQAVLALGRPGDVFVGISTSGNSRNILAAAEVAPAWPRWGFPARPAERWPGWLTSASACRLTKCTRCSSSTCRFTTACA